MDWMERLAALFEPTKPRYDIRQDIQGNVWVAIEYQGRLYEYNRTMMDSWEQQARQAGITWLQH